MLTPSMPLALICATVRWIVNPLRGCCRAEHMLRVPGVESNISMVSTTLVPFA